eukprot:1979897-Lingulodinium_polyedra.AAC.1
MPDGAPRKATATSRRGGKPSLVNPVLRPQDAPQDIAKLQGLGLRPLSTSAFEQLANGLHQSPIPQ